jgi:4a-hydroxytetrahydrobiopterin dehydratase
MTQPLDIPEGWTVLDGRLHQELTFADFDEAFAFMTRVAAEARRLDHHPDWSNSWNTVVIDIVDHSAGGITERCTALARAIDAVKAA